MAAPFIYVGNNRMKAGKLEAYQQDFMPKLVEVVESNEPRLLAFNVFANEEGTEIAGVQIHPDADSMLSHMQVMQERITMAMTSTSRPGRRSRSTVRRMTPYWR